jgi:hypothetical protein
MRDHIVTDGDSYLTIEEAAEIIKRPVATLKDWYRDRKATTLRALKAIADNKTRLGEQIYDTCRGRLTNKQVSVISGNSTASVYRRAKRHGWDSEVIFWPKMGRKELKARLKAKGLYIPPVKGEIPARATYKKLIDEKTSAKFTYAEIAPKIPVTVNTIRNYVDNHGCKTLQDCRAYKKYLDSGSKEPWVVPSSVSGVLKENGEMFDRTLDCMRSYDSGVVYEKCKHYVECSDCRAFEDRQHERYRSDGSCYEGVKLECCVHKTSPTGSSSCRFSI